VAVLNDTIYRALTENKENGQYGYIAPYYSQAISEDSTLLLGNARQRLAKRAKELKQLDKQTTKPTLNKSTVLLDDILQESFNQKRSFESVPPSNAGRLDSRLKIWLWGIPVIVAILVLYLLIPAQKASDPKNDKQLIEEMIYGLNDIATAPEQFTYIVSRNYPNFLDDSIAKACASGLKPATGNSYKPLTKPQTVEKISIKNISQSYSKNYVYDGSFGLDNKNFKGQKIIGRTYKVLVNDKLKSGGQTYSFDREIPVTIMDGKAFWFTRYC
jgi:hypothetical protein